MQSHDHVCQIDFLKKKIPKQKYLCPNPPVFPCDIFFFLLYYLSKITVDGSAGLELARVPRVPGTRGIFGQ